MPLNSLPNCCGLLFLKLEMSNQDDRNDKLPLLCLVLCVKGDSHRKGNRVIVSLDSTWRLQVHTSMAPTGIIILDSKDCYRDFPSMIFLQCTNELKSSAGFVCVGRHGYGILQWNLPGVIEDCFLCVMQADYSMKDKELSVAYHSTRQHDWNEPTRPDAKV